MDNKMYGDLYFENARGEEIFLTKCGSKDEVFEAIRNFCKSKKYTIPYVRSWGDQRESFFDVGSHSEFFILRY